MPIARGECVRQAPQPTYDHTIAAHGSLDGRAEIFWIVRLDPKTDDLARIFAARLD
jgi:hypothetical protein